MLRERRLALIALPVLASAGLAGCCDSWAIGAAPAIAPQPYAPVTAKLTADATVNFSAGRLPFGEGASSAAGSRRRAAPAPTPGGALAHRTATCWACLFPGGGHFYTGETSRAALLAGVAGGSLLTGALLSSDTPRRDEDYCDYDPVTHSCRAGSRNRTPLWIGAAVAAASWAYGILDAPRSVDRMNETRGFAIGRVEARPEPVVKLAGAAEPELGMGLRVRW